MPAVERRSGVEVRIDPEAGTVEGLALRYGDVATVGGLRETFAAGSVRVADAIPLNVDHDRGRTCARSPDSLTVTAGEDAVTFTANPVGLAGEDLRALIRAGVATGVSVEFEPVRESRATTPDGFPLRVIEQADLVGLAVTVGENPAYGDTSVSARSGSAKRVRRWL